MDPSDTQHPYYTPAGYLLPEVIDRAQVQDPQNPLHPMSTVPGLINLANHPMVDNVHASGKYLSPAAQELSSSQNPFDAEPFLDYNDPFDNHGAAGPDVPMITMKDSQAARHVPESAVVESSSVAGPSTTAGPSSIAGRSPITSPSTPNNARRIHAQQSLAPTPSSSRQLVMPEGRKKNGEPIDWNFTETPVSVKANGNGRQAGRNLINWGRPRMYEKLMLHTQYELNRHGVNVPWDYIAHRFHPGSSGQAIQQHLHRLRTTLIAEGHLVPPVHVKNRAAVPSRIRGYIRAHPEGDDSTNTREVPWSEPIWDRQFSLAHNDNDQSVTNSVKRTSDMARLSLADSAKQPRLSQEMTSPGNHGAWETGTSAGKAEQDSDMGDAEMASPNLDLFRFSAGQPPRPFQPPSFSSNNKAGHPSQTTQSSLASIPQHPNAQSSLIPTKNNSKRPSVEMPTRRGHQAEIERLECENSRLQGEIDLLRNDAVNRDNLHHYEVARVRYDARTEGIQHGFMLARSNPHAVSPPIRNFEDFQLALDNQPRQVYQPAQAAQPHVAYGTNVDQQAPNSPSLVFSADPAGGQSVHSTFMIGSYGVGPAYQMMMQPLSAPVAVAARVDIQSLRDYRGYNPAADPFIHDYQQQYVEGSSNAVTNNPPEYRELVGNDAPQMSDLAQLWQSNEGAPSATQARSLTNRSYARQRASENANQSADQNADQSAAQSANQSANQHARELVTHRARELSSRLVANAATLQANELAFRQAAYQQAGEQDDPYEEFFARAIEDSRRTAGEEAQNSSQQQESRPQE